MEALTKPQTLYTSDFDPWLEYMVELERQGETPTLYLLITEWT